MIASAAFFSLNDILSSITPQTSAAGSSENSQTTAALVAPNNSNLTSGDSSALTLVDGSALFAPSGPAGTAADVAAAPQSSTISVYTVHEGDTLSGIAQMFG